MSVASSNMFTKVEDITCHPTRMQSEVGEERENKGNEVDALEKDIPNLLTLERAIRYYESNASGKYLKLYEFTAKQLRELLNKNIEVNSQEEE